MEEEGPAGDTQVSGLSTWWVIVPFPEMGSLQMGRAGVGIRFGARGTLGLRSLQIAERMPGCCSRGPGGLGPSIKADSWSFYH